MAVIFQADLSFMPIQDIFQWIDMNRLSCCATISRDNDEDVTFYLEEGKIIFATSQKPGYRLGESLVKVGALTAFQADQALRDITLSGALFTRLLVDRNWVTIETLTKVFEDLVENLLVDIFSRTSSMVTVSTPLPDSALKGPIQLETGRAIFDAVRVMDEVRRDARTLDSAYEEINKRLFDEDFELPAMPGIITHLVRIMEDEKSTFQDMAKLIMTDQVLISSILKVANSSFYGGTGKVDSLQFAIVKLGLKEIRNIVTAIQIRSLKFKDVPREQLQEILDNSMKIAFIASGLARCCRLDPEEAFVGGLLLDLGKTVILNVAKNIKIEKSLLDNLIDTRHAEIGAMIARKWNYPETIQNMIRYHHYRNFGEFSNRMIEMVQVADQIVQMDGEGDIDQERCVSLGLSYEMIMDAYDKAMDTFSQIKSLSE